MTKNSCDCPNPPGGRAVCEAHQMAICRVREGVAVTECIDPPTPQGTAEEQQIQLLNWAISLVTGQTDKGLAPIDPLDAQIILGGRYDNVESGEVTTFKLPNDLDMLSVILKSRLRDSAGAQQKAQA
jgi:hypothetical protein